MKLAFEQYLMNKLMGLMVGGCAGVVLASTSAQAIEITGTVGGKAVDVSYTLSAGAGEVTVTLQDLEADPTAVSQLISGFSFAVSGLSGSRSLSTVNTGDIIHVASDGTFGTPAANSLAHWTAGESGTTIKLTTLSGGHPVDLIIGQPDSGSGIYDEADGSIAGNGPHNPFVDLTATFQVSIPGVTDSSTISDETIYFGTTPCTTMDNPRVSSVPDGGSTLAFLGFAMLGLVFLRGKSGFAFGGKNA